MAYLKSRWQRPGDKEKDRKAQSVGSKHRIVLSAVVVVGKISGAAEYKRRSHGGGNRPASETRHAASGTIPSLTHATSLSFWRLLEMTLLHLLRSVRDDFMRFS